MFLSGAAGTDKGAAELCEAMQRSGLLLRHHDVVYLRMEEITEMIAKVNHATCATALQPQLHYCIRQPNGHHTIHKQSAFCAEWFSIEVVVEACMQCT